MISRERSDLRARSDRPLHLPYVRAADTFDRANGAVGTSSSGHVWTVHRGAAAVASNLLSSTTAVGGTELTVDALVADCTVSMDWTTWALGGQVGLLLRATSEINGYVVVPNITNTRIDVLRLVNSASNSSGSVPGTWDWTGTPSPGDRISGVLNGDAITVKRNGVVIISVTDPGSPLRGNTRHGVKFTNDLTARANNFEVYG